MKASQQRGNILFLILLAVVLFAALSYAVTSSTRGGGKDISAETAQSRAARYLQFSTNMANIVQRMALNGVKDVEFKFAGNYRSTNGNGFCGSNPNCAVGSACDVFHPSGGGALPLKFEDIAFTPPGCCSASPSLTMPGNVTFGQGGVAGIGTDAPDLVMMIGGVDPATCNEINRSMGITTSFTDASPAVENVSTSRPQPLVNCPGTHYGFTSTNVIGDQDARFFGQHTFCLSLNSSAPNGYLELFQVLLAR